MCVPNDSTAAGAAVTYSISAIIGHKKIESGFPIKRSYVIVIRCRFTVSMKKQNVGGINPGWEKSTADANAFLYLNPSGDGFERFSHLLPAWKKQPANDFGVIHFFRAL